MEEFKGWVLRIEEDGIKHSFVDKIEELPEKAKIYSVQASRFHTQIFISKFNEEDQFYQYIMMRCSTNSEAKFTCKEFDDLFTDTKKPEDLKPLFEIDFSSPGTDNIELIVAT